MIQNERQYRITRAQARKFEQAIKKRARTDPTLIPELRKARQEALQSQLEDLQHELREYEKLQSTEPRSITIESIEALPAALIRARIAIGLTQKQLARRLGLKEQQIQRYEATSYAGISFERIGRVMAALGVTLRKGVIAIRRASARKVA